MNNTGKIIRIQSGMSNCYFVIGENGAYAVDTGFETGTEAALANIKAAGLKPEDIKLIIITHGHVDHFMNINALVEITHAPVLCHVNSAESIEKGLLPNADMEGRTELGRRIIKYESIHGAPAEKAPCHTVTYKIGNSGLDLGEFGLPGQLVFTPGHSRGCISVVVGDEAIVGDLFTAPAGTEYATMPYFQYVGAPFEEPEQSIKKLLDMGINRFWLGHGSERDREYVESALNKELAGVIEDFPVCLL